MITNDGGIVDPKRGDRVTVVARRMAAGDHRNAPVQPTSAEANPFLIGPEDKATLSPRQWSHCVRADVRRLP
jgi:hypothetical protein